VPETPSDVVLEGENMVLEGGNVVLDSGNMAVRSSNLDTNHDSSCPLQIRDVNNILGGADATGPVARYLHYNLLLLADELQLVGGEEPATFVEEKQEGAWRAAMLEEMAAIEWNKTWCLVKLPTGDCPIGLKWVFKLKKDAAGNVIKHKAKLVAKGYVQKKGGGL
jgi:hypothetical protein